jgi:hypothetical protein
LYKCIREHRHPGDLFPNFPQRCEIPVKYLSNYR